MTGLWSENSEILRLESLNFGQNKAENANRRHMSGALMANWKAS